MNKQPEQLQGATKSKDIITNPLIKFQMKPTRGNAIKAKCAECVGCTIEETEPGFREHIRGCTAPKCPLFNFRPYK